MKRKLEEKKRQDAEAQQQQKVEEELKNTATQYFFNVGERVFHDKLGVGQIADVIQIGDSTMYTIDFGHYFILRSITKSKTTFPMSKRRAYNWCIRC